MSFKDGRIGVGKDPIFPLDISGSCRIDGDLVLGGRFSDSLGNPIQLGSGSGASSTPDQTSSSLPSWEGGTISTQGLGIFKGRLDTTKDSIYISGNNDWNANTTGSFNSTLGYMSGYSMTSTNSNTFMGWSAGYYTTGGQNTFIGTEAGRYATSNSQNTFIGDECGRGVHPMTGGENTCIGAFSGYALTSASSNTFVGRCAGYTNSSGAQNTFVGMYSGGLNTTGSYNTMLGFHAGYNNTTGYQNVFIGHKAGQNQTTSYENVCVGFECLGFGTGAGYKNAMLGYQAGYKSTTGRHNVYMGYRTGYQTTTGYYNTYLGVHAGNKTTSGHTNVAVGGDCGLNMTTGTYNAMLGVNAGWNVTTASNNVYIGMQAGFTQTTSGNNVMIGRDAGFSSTAGNCTFIGYQAGYSVVNSYNIAIGYYAMRANANNYNVAIGDQALSLGANTSKSNNVAIGYRALEDCTHYSNVAVGANAGENVTSGYENTYLGYQAGMKCTTGMGNVAIGTQPMGSADAATAVTSNYSVAIGRYALRSATSGGSNVAIGASSGKDITTGSSNTCVGYLAGTNITSATYNTCIGYNTANELTTGGGNVCLGMEAGYYTNTAATGCIFIGRYTGPKSSDGNHHNRLAIGAPAGQNSDTYKGYNGAFLWGDFNSTALANRYLRINGHLGIGIEPGTGNGIRVASGNAVFDNTVGIGTTSLFCNLHVAKGNANQVGSNPSNIADYYLLIGGNEWTDDQRCLIAFGYTYASNHQPPAYIGYKATNSSNYSNGALVFGTRNTTGATDLATERMRIAADGNVGIGTSDPDNLLHLKGGYPLKIEGSNDTAKYTIFDYNQLSSYGDKFHINHATDKDVVIACGGGNVAIGKETPGFPLDVGGYVTANGGSVGYMNSSGIHTTSSASSDSISIKSQYVIWCTSYIMANSDHRIKENIVDVPDNLALKMVRNIPCRYYEYKDKLKKGFNKTIGFIAQEVKEHFPMAVSIQKEIIPNEMRKLENISWEEITDNSSNKYKLTTDLQDISGIKYNFYVSNDSSGNNEREKEVIGNSDNTFTFEEKWNNVFCYGKEVDDFHTLDKQKLFALNFSATQELDRKVITLENENAELKARLAKLEAFLGL